MLKKDDNKTDPRIHVRGAKERKSLASLGVVALGILIGTCIALFVSPPLDQSSVENSGGAEFLGDRVPMRVVREREPASVPTDKERPATLRAERTVGPILKNNFPNSRIIAEWESPVDSRGNLTRIKVLETQMKYPVVRVVERIRRVPVAAGGVGETLITHEEMAGDHVLVKLKDGHTEADMAAIAAKHGGRILEYKPLTKTFLIAFDGANPAAVDEMVEGFKGETDSVSVTEPNYIVRTPNPIASN